MKNILIHGLGQDEKAWDKVIKELSDDVKVLSPNLFGLIKEKKMNYENLYNAFSDYCNNKKEKLNLCGLSLGGILAIDYAKQYPEKVNSLIINSIPFSLRSKGTHRNESLELKAFSLYNTSKEYILQSTWE